MSKIVKNLFLIVLVASLSASCSHKEVSVMPDIVVKNHTYSNYDSIELKHIHLKLHVNFDKKRLEGSARLDINNHSGARHLILDTKGLEIDKITIAEDIEAAYSITAINGKEDDILGQALVIELEKTTESVTIHYQTGKDAAALMWLDPEQTHDKKHPFLFTQSQAILARSWVPCMDVPAVRFTYSAEITCNEEFLPLMSAENPQTKREGTYQFKMDKKIPSYLLALAVGDIEFKSLGENCGVYAEPGMMESSFYEFKDLPDMITAAEGLYGEYVWGRYDLLVLPPSFPFGGMENPKLTFVTPTIIAGDRSLVSLIAHELAHSWSGNLVTNRTWDDFWLNEGFTVYFEDRIMEKIYGKEYADMLMELNSGELKRSLETLLRTAPGDTKLKLTLVNRDPDEGVSDIAYVKGCLFLKMLEKKYGRNEFDAFLKAYFDHFKWKTVTTEMFLEYLDEHLMKKFPEIEVNVKQWVYEIGIPDNCPFVTSKEFVRVGNMADSFNLNRNLSAIDTTGFTTQHWMHLLRNLKADSIKNSMTDIDSLYHLSESKNSEIQCDWYILCIQAQYDYAKPFIEKYLMEVGRRKFLTPLYEKMVETKEGKVWAKNIYEKASPRYHSVSRGTIKELLSENSDN